MGATADYRRKFMDIVFDPLLAEGQDAEDPGRFLEILQAHHDVALEHRRLTKFLAMLAKAKFADDPAVQAALDRLAEPKPPEAGDGPAEAEPEDAPRESGHRTGKTSAGSFPPGHSTHGTAIPQVVPRPDRQVLAGDEPAHHEPDGITDRAKSPEAAFSAEFASIPLPPPWSHGRRDRLRESQIITFVTLARLSFGDGRAVDVDALLDSLNACGLTVQRNSFITKLNRLRSEVEYVHWEQQSRARDISITTPGTRYLLQLYDRLMKPEDIAFILKCLDLSGRNFDDLRLHQAGGSDT